MTADAGQLVALVYGESRDSQLANARLLAAAYNAFDSAGKKLGVNAVELAERMQDGGIAEFVEALQDLLAQEAAWKGFNDDGLETERARAIIAKLKGGAS